VQLALNDADVDAAVEFYSTLFGAEPAKRRPEYAWSPPSRRAATPITGCSPARWRTCPGSCPRGPGGRQARPSAGGPADDRTLQAAGVRTLLARKAFAELLGSLLLQRLWSVLGSPRSG